MDSGLTCSQCGEANPSRARFCLACGAPLTTPAELRPQVRKTVTVLFADVTGSTELGERLDAEAVRRLMGAYFEEMSGVLERHGGTVEKFVRDAIMAGFRHPGRARGRRPARRSRRRRDATRPRLVSLNGDLDRQHRVTLRVRTGVNTGEVVAGDRGTSEHLVTGDPVNMAARLEQAAAPDEILLGESTYRLVRDAVEVDEAPLIAATTDFLTLQALAYGSLAEVERLDGRPDEAVTALRQALDRCERKEDLPDADRVRAQIDALRDEVGASR